MPKLGAHPGVTEDLVASAARTTSDDFGVLTGWDVPEVTRCR